MTDEKWTEIIERIKDAFTVESEYDEPLDDMPGKKQGVIFESPAGKRKLERTIHPIVVGTRGMGAKRIGAAMRVAYDYSETETSTTVVLYEWKNGGWAEIDLDGSGFGALLGQNDVK